jgi:hypothetical protein
MLDYIPLIVTFALAIVGLSLKTTRDPDGTSLRKRLTAGGWAVLFLLVVSLTLGVATTLKRKAVETKSSQRNAARYERDSATAAANLTAANTQLLVQRGAIDEARSAAAIQMDRLEATLLASNLLALNLRGLSDTLRARTLELDRELAEQRQVLMAETDRLRHPITTPRVYLSVYFPPIDEAKQIALTLLDHHRLDMTDSAREHRREVITDSRYGEQALLSLSQEIPYRFPYTFIIKLWPLPPSGVCDVRETNPFISSLLNTPLRPSVGIIGNTSPAMWTPSEHNGLFEIDIFGF